MINFKSKTSNLENATDWSVHLNSLSIRLNVSLCNLEVDRWPALTNEQDSSRTKSAYLKNNFL